MRYVADLELPAAVTFQLEYEKSTHNLRTKKISRSHQHIARITMTCLHTVFYRQ